MLPKEKILEILFMGTSSLNHLTRANDSAESIPRCNINDGNKNNNRFMTPSKLGKNMNGNSRRGSTDDDNDDDDDIGKLIYSMSNTAKAHRIKENMKIPPDKINNPPLLRDLRGGVSDIIRLSIIHHPHQNTV